MGDGQKALAAVRRFQQSVVFKTRAQLKKQTPNDRPPRTESRRFDADIVLFSLGGNSKAVFLEGIYLLVAADQTN